MRIDSCRRCGETLAVTKHCQVCNQPIQFKCESCFKYVEDPIHSKCQFIVVS